MFILHLLVLYTVVDSNNNRIQIFDTIYTVSVNATGNGSGSISSDKLGSYSFPSMNSVLNSITKGSNIVITATADFGSNVSWSGCDSTNGTVTSSTCTISDLISDRVINVTFTTVPIRQLNVTLNHDGYGTVTSMPTGISCANVNNDLCTGDFTSGDTVTLTSTPSIGSTLFAWEGCNNITQDKCIVLMDTNKNVTASFDILDNARLGAGTKHYGTLRTAYNDAQDTGVIKAKDIIFIEDLIIDKNIYVTLSGGYDNNFTSNIGNTKLHGQLILKNGTLSVDRLSVF